MKVQLTGAIFLLLSAVLTGFFIFDLLSENSSRNCRASGYILTSSVTDILIYLIMGISLIKDLNFQNPSRMIKLCFAIIFPTSCALMLMFSTIALISVSDHLHCYQYSIFSLIIFSLSILNILFLFLIPLGGIYSPLMNFYLEFLPFLGLLLKNRPVPTEYVYLDRADISYINV